MKTLGKTIRLLRKARRMTCQQLSREIGASAGYISLLERGKRDLAFSTAEKISQVLGVPLFLLVFMGEELTDTQKELFGEQLLGKLSTLSIGHLKGGD